MREKVQEMAFQLDLFRTNSKAEMQREKEKTKKLLELLQNATIERDEARNQLMRVLMNPLKLSPESSYVLLPVQRLHTPASQEFANAGSINRTPQWPHISIENIDKKFFQGTVDAGQQIPVTEESVGVSNSQQRNPPLLQLFQDSSVPRDLKRTREQL